MERDRGLGGPAGAGVDYALIDAQEGSRIDSGSGSSADPEGVSVAMFAPRVARAHANSTASTTQSAERQIAATLRGRQSGRESRRDDEEPSESRGKISPRGLLGRGWNLSTVALFSPDESLARSPPAAADIIHNVLQSGGEPLDPRTRQFAERGFQRDFSGVRIHTGAQAAASARAVNALAYTVGKHIAFDDSAYQPRSAAGRRLLLHELAHTAQQTPWRSGTPLRISDPTDAAEREADASVEEILASRTARPLTSGLALVARQPKPGTKQGTTEQEGEVAPAKDTFAGTKITEIIVSLSRGRVGFRWAMGMIMGDIETDLKPGAYELKPDPAHQKWNIVKPAVKSGSRFEVTLEGALPWTLSYPETLPLTVAPGAPLPKDTDKFDPKLLVVDPLALYEGWPSGGKLTPVQGIDDFESTRYDLDYKSEKGALSKWIRVYYRDNTVKDINIDTITENTPKLAAVKREVLIAMDNYNAMFILQFGFPLVFMIITINPVGMPAPGRGVRYTASRRTFSTVNGEEVIDPPVKGGKSGTGKPPAGASVDEAPNVGEPSTGETAAPKTSTNKSVIDASNKAVPKSDGTFRLNRKLFSNPEKVVGEPESVVQEDANREAVAADLAASKPNVEKVYVGKEADKFINASVGEEPSADVVAVTKDGKYYVYEAGGSDVSPRKLEQLGHTSEQLGSGSVQRQTLVIKGKLTTPGYTVENGVLMSGGKRVMVDGKPVYIKFTTQ